MLKNKTAINQIQLKLLESQKMNWCCTLETIIAVIKSDFIIVMSILGMVLQQFYTNIIFSKQSFDSVMHECIHRIEYSK